MIEVKHLTKQYGSHTAVSDLSFTFTKGKIYGFLGPNGAGKTTTMNIITGCLAATSGEVKIGGYDIFEQPMEAKKLIGYLPELPPLYLDQTVTEYLYFVARAKGFKKSETEEEIKKVIEETHIEDVADKLIKHLSKGYRQRVGIAQALIGSPEIIILDEPTVGLDPTQIVEIRDFIKELGENHTVVLSSHILSEVQAVCDEVLIIHKGKLVAFDKIENLSMALSSGNTIEICCEATADEIKDLLKDIEGVVSVNIKEENENSCSLTLAVGEANPKEICREIFLVCAKNEKVLQQLNPVRATLEDIFMKITTGQDEVEAENTYADEFLQEEKEEPEDGGMASEEEEGTLEVGTDKEDDEAPEDDASGTETQEPESKDKQDNVEEVAE